MKNKFLLSLCLYPIGLVLMLSLASCNLYRLLNGTPIEESNSLPWATTVNPDDNTPREVTWTTPVDEDMPAEIELGSVEDEGDIYKTDFTVKVYAGDARTFSRPPTVFYANTVEFPSPPGGVISCQAAFPNRYDNWLSVGGTGESVEITTTEDVEALGVQFWGDHVDGYAEVLVDGTLIWRGNTFYDNCPQLDENGNRIVSRETCSGAFTYYIEASDLEYGKHTLRVVNAGGGETTVFFFGIGKVKP